MLTESVLFGAVGCYLTLTFTAAALAKLRTWRGSTLTVIRERVFPARLGLAVVVTISLVELSLATLVMLGLARVVTGYAVAGVSAGFGGYRLAVAARTRSLTCACVGPVRYGPATPQAISAVIVTSAFQIGAGYAWALSGDHPESYGVKLACVLAWAVPFAALSVGIFSHKLARGARTVGEITSSASLEPVPE